MKVFLGAALFCACAAASHAGTTVTPVASVSLLGGQYWASGASPESFGGNIDLFFSPVINFTPGTALLPMYSATYSGTKDVRDLVGGGTMTREAQDHSLALKFVHKLTPDLKLKLRVGYKKEWLKETVDETWGQGLFDYDKMIGGIEGEYAKELWKGRLGLDYYVMRYPNYLSLVTQNGFQTALDTTTYSELSAQAGTNVLDYTAFAFFAETARAFSPSVSGIVHYDLSVKDFADQRVVRSSGLFSRTLRRDYVHCLSFGLTAAAPRVVLNLTDGMQYYVSNQNSFDMANGDFVPGFYDFAENTVMPNITFALGPIERPSKLTLFWELAYRRYLTRPAQYANGDPKSETTTQTTNTLGCSYRYPLASSLSLKLSANYRDASSNMRFEKNYTYNYYTFNYFAGFTWEL